VGGRPETGEELRKGGVCWGGVARHLKKFERKDSGGRPVSTQRRLHPQVLQGSWPQGSLGWVAACKASHEASAFVVAPALRRSYCKLAVSACA